MASRRKQRVAAKAALEGFLNPLDRRHVAATFYQAATGLRELAERLAAPGSLRASLPASVPLDPWTLPDAAWQAVVATRRELERYPLGEVVERAAKKALAERLRETGFHPGADGGAPEEAARRALAEPGDRLLRRFLAWLFFEMSLDVLRRGSSNLEKDFGYRYHFTAAGGSVDPAAEERWRGRLLAQCEALAARFAPCLLASLKQEDVLGVDTLIAAGFERALGRTPFAAARAAEPVVEVVSGPRRAAPAEPPGAGPNGGPLALVLGAGGGNVYLSLRRHRATDSGGRKASTSALKELPPRAQDLIELGVAVYVADLQVRRQSHLGRRLRLEVAVREPALWEGAREEVERAAAFLGRDDVEIRFVPRPDDAVAPPLALDEDVAGSCVALFSGGLDSLAGAVHLLDLGERPVLVSHYASKVLAGLQRRLAREVAARTAQPPLSHLGLYAARASKRRADEPLDRGAPRLMPQYLRAFLFLSAACAVAAHLEVETVYLPECGPLALNPLFSEARTNTRSVHPGFLTAFERLARRICGASLAIRNPFLYATKGEAAAHLAGAERAPLVRGSLSCWNWARVPRIAQQRNITAKPATRQCGECLPCLGRRAGLHAAGLTALDADYLIDVFSDLFTAKAHVPRERRTAVLDYVRFCRHLAATPAAELLVAWPDLSVAVEGMDGARLATMLHRHAGEVLGAFSALAGDEVRAKLGFAPGAATAQAPAAASKAGVPRSTARGTGKMPRRPGKRTGSPKSTAPSTTKP